MGPELCWTSTALLRLTSFGVKKNNSMRYPEDQNFNRVGKNSLQGKQGVKRSLELVLPRFVGNPLAKAIRYLAVSSSLTSQVFL
jgi:hypothetical protein